VLAAVGKLRARKAKSPPPTSLPRDLEVVLSRHIELAWYSRGMQGAEKFANVDEGVPAKMRQWHAHAVSNSEEIRAGKTCGCFHCGSSCEASEFTEWMWEPDGSSAMCARRGVDSLIGDASGAPSNEDFLLEIRDWWL
jgi:hypothetical protein